MVNRDEIIETENEKSQLKHTQREEEREVYSLVSVCMCVRALGISAVKMREFTSVRVFASLSMLCSHWNSDGSKANTGTLSRNQLGKKGNEKYELKSREEELNGYTANRGRRHEERTGRKLVVQQGNNVGDVRPWKAEEEKKEREKRSPTIRSRPSNKAGEKKKKSLL